MRPLLIACLFGALLFTSIDGVRAQGHSVPLESLPRIGGGGCVIAAACPGASQGVALSHGLHIDASTFAEFRLGHQYTSIAGTIYIDDSSSDSYLSVSIDDVSGGARRPIFYSSFSPSHPTITFALGVEGVDSLSITPQTEGNAIDIVATLISVPGAPAPAPPPVMTKAATMVTTVLPSANADLTGLPQVPFAWRPYSDAAAYFLQVWLTRAAPGQKVTARSRINFATTTVSLHYELPTNGMLKGTYHWRIAALSAGGTLISHWTPEADMLLN